MIADVTRRMGEGMAKYAGEKTVVTLDDYNEYCHYVAGLFGIGLSQMFLPPLASSVRRRGLLVDFCRKPSLTCFLIF